MKYEGVVLSDKLEGGNRKSCEIETTLNQVILVIDQEKISWPLNDITLEKGGSGGQLIYLKHKTDQDYTVYTRDKGLLKDPNLNRNKAVFDATQEVRKSFLKDRSLIALVLILIISIPVSLITFKSFFVNAISEKVPVQWEVDAGDKLFESLSKQYSVIEDSVISAKLDSLFEPLVKATEYDEVEFKFYICDDPSLNAFALPGGHVVINTGTIYQVDQIEELYGVIGHELAHVTKRHHLRGIIGNLGTFLLLQGMIGGEAGILGSLGESAGQLNNLFYSRQFETESDVAGYEYLKKARINPIGMVDFFKRIEASQVSVVDTSILGEAEDAMKELGSFISTHPGTAERIQYLTDKIEQEDIGYMSQEYKVEDLKQFIEKHIN